MPLPALKPLAVLVLVGGLVAGCSAGGSDADPDGGSSPVVVPSGLAGALGKVRATEETRAAVEYGAPARVRELGTRFLALEGYGYGTIAASVKRVDEAIGVDPGSFDEAITVGQPPRWGAVLWGDYDVGAVDERLADLGIERVEQDGASVWKSGADLEVAFDGPFKGVVPLNQFNSVRTADGSFAFAPLAAGVEWVTDAGSGTLAEDERIAGLARCLGDVVAARIDQGAAGAREDGTEVFCLDGDQDAVEEALGGLVPSTGEPWDEFLPGAGVEQDGDLVRVVVPSVEGQPVGRVLRAHMAGDLRTLG